MTVQITSPTTKTCPVTASCCFSPLQTCGTKSDGSKADTFNSVTGIDTACPAGYQWCNNGYCVNQNYNETTKTCPAPVTANSCIKGGPGVASYPGTKGSKEWCDCAESNGDTGSLINEKCPQASAQAAVSCDDSRYKTTSICQSFTTYDKCTDNKSQTGTSLCQNGATSFYCQSSANPNNCDSRYSGGQKVTEFNYSCSACPNLAASGGGGSTGETVCKPTKTVCRQQVYDKVTRRCVGDKVYYDSKQTGQETNCTGTIECSTETCSQETGN